MSTVGHYRYGKTLLVVVIQESKSKGSTAILNIASHHTRGKRGLWRTLHWQLNVTFTCNLLARIGHESSNNQRGPGVHSYHVHGGMRTRSIWEANKVLNMCKQVQIRGLSG